MPKYDCDVQVNSGTYTLLNLDSSAPDAAAEALRLRSLEHIIAPHGNGVILIPRGAIQTLKVRVSSEV